MSCEHCGSNETLWEQISGILGVIRPLCHLFPDFRGINGERTDMLIKRLVAVVVPAIERDRALIAELRAALVEARQWMLDEPDRDGVSTVGARIDALLERTKP